MKAQRPENMRKLGRHFAIDTSSTDWHPSGRVGGFWRSSCSTRWRLDCGPPKHCLRSTRSVNFGACQTAKSLAS